MSALSKIKELEAKLQAKRGGPLASRDGGKALVDSLSPPPPASVSHKQHRNGCFQSILDKVEQTQAASSLSKKADWQFASPKPRGASSNSHDAVDDEATAATQSPLTLYFNKSRQRRRRSAPKVQLAKAHTIQEVLLELDGTIAHAGLAEYEGLIPLRIPLYPHQKQGLNWLIRQEKSRWKGGILADSMGLGKTVQMLALISCQRLHGRGEGTTLIICAPGLVEQWKSEITGKGEVGLTINVFQGVKRDFNVLGYDIVIASYGVVASIPDSVEFVRIICDEGHKMRNYQTKLAQICCNVKAEYRWIVSGTPIQNSIMDLYSLCLYLRTPDYSVLSYFQDAFGKGSSKVLVPVAVVELRQFLPKILLRRTKEKIDLPKLYVTDLRLVFSEKERQGYQTVLERVKQSMEVRGCSERIAAWSMLLRGKQACNHLDSVGGSFFEPMAEPDGLESLMNGLKIEEGDKEVDELLISKFGRLGFPIDDGAGEEASDSTFEEEEEVEAGDGIRDSTKLSALVNILQKNCKSGEKTVVFSQFVTMIKLIEKKLRSIGIPCILYHGSLPPRERDRLLNEYRLDDSPAVLLASLMAAAEGLNLTVANNVVLYDIWYNPAVEDQAIARAYRLGQRRDVSVTRLIMSGTCEEKIVEIQKRKNLLCAAALGVDHKSLRREIEGEIVAYFRKGSSSQ